MKKLAHFCSRIVYPNFAVLSCLVLRMLGLAAIQLCLAGNILAQAPAAPSTETGATAGVFVDGVDVQVIMPKPNGTRAKAKVQVNADGTVSAVTVTDPGSGYGFTPWVTVETPEGATAPVLETTCADGKIATIKVMSGGSGYHPELPPDIAIESPNRPAEAHAVLTPNSLAGIQVTDPGSGYVSSSAGFNVDFYPKKKASLVIARATRFGLGEAGQILAVQGGDGYYTLRGLAAPQASRALVRAAGYYVPGDGGGGMFYWNPDRNFAMLKQVTVVDGGSDYRPGDVIWLNNAERFLVTEITKKGSAQFPEGTCPDLSEVSLTGKVDVGSIARLVALENHQFSVVPTDLKWSNSTATWSNISNVTTAADKGWDDASNRLIIPKSTNPPNNPASLFERGQILHGQTSGATGVVGEFGDDGKNYFITLIHSTVKGTFANAEQVKNLDGPGSGLPFVRGMGDLKFSLTWAADNGGSVVNPCNHESAGRWERLYDNDNNNIRFYGARDDSSTDGVTVGTDNTWPIQMAMTSCVAQDDPAFKKNVFIPGVGESPQGYLTGTLNISAGINIKGEGGGVLIGKPGQDVLSTIIPAIDYPFNRRSQQHKTFQGFAMVVNERADPTAVGGTADAESYKARRLYKAMRWDRERNSQRWGAMTFLEADPVSDRRYFGTDDSLDPEQAPPINAVEPARRIYYVLADTEFSDKVTSLEVDPRHRGFVVAHTPLILEGGVPVFGSKIGPGKVNDVANYGKLGAGKAQAVVDRLFVPEAGLEYRAELGAFVPSSVTRTPLLEGQIYTFAMRDVKTDADPSGATPTTFNTVCVHDANTNGLVLSLTDHAPKTGEAADGRLEALGLLSVKRGSGNSDDVAITNNNQVQHARVTAVMAVVDESGSYYQDGHDFNVQAPDGTKVSSALALPNLYQAPAGSSPGQTNFKLVWNSANQPVAGRNYTITYSYICPKPLGNQGVASVRWLGGPAGSVTIAKDSLSNALNGSYKYKPAEEPIAHLESSSGLSAWDVYAKNGPRVYFGDRSPADDGFRVGQAIKGATSEAGGIIKAFGHDGRRYYAALDQWNLQDFHAGEKLVPAFNEQMDVSTRLLGSSFGEASIKPGMSCRSKAAFEPQAVFASDNPVSGSTAIALDHGPSETDVANLSKAGGALYDYYPWKIVGVTDASGTSYEAGLDFNPTIDARRQKISLQWSGAWAGKSPQAKVPSGKYSVQVCYYAGSPSHENLPWPEWRKLTGGSFHDPQFLGGQDGQIVTQGPDGQITGKIYNPGADYTVKYDAATNVGTIAWTSGAPSGNLWIKYRKAVDNYDAVPWGSPKQLSRKLNNTALMDPSERFMGNFGFIDQSVNYPGYPPEVSAGEMYTTFRDLKVEADGAVQATSGGLYIPGNYSGTHENLTFRDTNYGFIMPMNLYYPWQNLGVRNDGTIVHFAPASEGASALFSEKVWDSNADQSMRYIVNKYQLVIGYKNGSEQSTFDNFNLRCGDIGLFVTHCYFYQMENIWASGANSFDRPRGSTMIFGKPINGVELFTNAGQFGPLDRMFGEQALNGDYALPSIRCCANGGQEVDFGAVTQGRQVVWGNDTVGQAANGRATVNLGGRPYGMGIWGPIKMRVSVTAGSKTIGVESLGAGFDKSTLMTLRNGATYWLQIPGAGANGWDLRSSFIYDASKPMSAQQLLDPAEQSVSDVSVNVTNTNIKKTDFNPIETAKINWDYGWSIMVCGNNNKIRVSPETLQDRARRILDEGTGNDFTDGTSQRAHGSGEVATATNILNGASYAVSGDTVTVTKAAHGLFDGEHIVVENALDSDGNTLTALDGSFVISVLSADQFTFRVPNSGASGGKLDVSSYRAKVMHNLGVVPANISVTPTTSSSFWVMSRDDKSFTVNCTSATSFPARFDWSAEQ